VSGSDPKLVEKGTMPIPRENMLHGVSFEIKNNRLPQRDDDMKHRVSRIDRLAIVVGILGIVIPMVIAKGFT
jgi:hypothetical protein